MPTFLGSSTNVCSTKQLSEVETFAVLVGTGVMTMISCDGCSQPMTTLCTGKGPRQRNVASCVY